MFARDSNYTLEFYCTPMLAKDSLLEIFIPKQIEIDDPNLIVNKGSCASTEYQCTYDSDEHKVILALQFEAQANHGFRIELTGVHNPRSFRPTDLFKIIAYN